MAKIFRFSGYYVEMEDIESSEEFRNRVIKRLVCFNDIFQQLHVEESESFELDGEDKENCDLALLTRHFKKDNSNMQFDRPLPVAGEKYKHFKLGKIVTVKSDDFTKNLQTLVYKQGYNKAIDDFVNQFNVIVDEKCGTDTNNYFRKIVKEVAEQLKESEAE